MSESDVVVGVGLLAFITWLLWMVLGREKQPDYCAFGYLQRDPTELEVQGVNVVGSSQDMPYELEVASERFNTVRFWCTRFLEEWLDGKDSFASVLETLPDGVRLIPVLFSCGTYNGIMKNLTVEQQHAWVDYWMQFQDSFLYIDVFNEPFLQPCREVADWLKTTLEYVKDRAVVPISVGFALSNGEPKEVYLQRVREIEPYCDLMSFHFYGKGEKYRETLVCAIEFYRGFGKLVVVSEFNNDSGEREQACWLSNVLHVIKGLNVMGCCVHNLHEPLHLDPEPPWGIYRRDWTAKPCVELFP